MSGFQSENSGIAASTFLALYTLFLAYMIYVVYRKGFKTVYTFLLIFTLFRFGGQLCGVVYASLGPAHYQWLIAYLVLGAEGYFTLIFAAFRFTCQAQVEKLGRSWVLESGPKFPIFGFKRLSRTWNASFHTILIPANALVIAGGSLLAGIDYNNMGEIHQKEVTSEILRTVGQSLFLFMTALLILLNIYVYFKERVRTHVTIAVMCAAPLLLVRGIFGILSIYITKMNYFKLTNYNDEGLVNHDLVIYEYVLSTTMEFVAGVILMSKYYFDLRYTGTKLDEESVQSVETSKGEVGKGENM